MWLARSLSEKPLTMTLGLVSSAYTGFWGSSLFEYSPSCPVGSSTSSPHPNTLLLTPLPLHLPLQSQEQSGFPALWEIQVPSPSLQVQEGEHPNRPGSQKASPCRRNKTQCHCQWLLSLHLDLGGSVSPHVSHIQRIRFDQMLVQSQSSWPW